MKRVFVSGQIVEYWSNPDVVFGWGHSDLQGYLDRNAWVLLFNAVVLTTPRPDPDWPS